MFIFHHVLLWLEKRELTSILHKFEKATLTGEQCYVHICFSETIHYLYTHDYWLEHCKGNLYFITL